MFSFIARAKRSLAGKNVSRSITPTFWNGGRLHGVDQARHVEVVARAPGVIQDVGEQDVLAAGDRVGVDAQERQQPGDGRGDPLAIGFGLVDQAGGGASNERSTVSGSPAVLPGV